MLTDVPLRTGLTPSTVIGGSLGVAIAILSIIGLVASGVIASRRRT